MVYERGWTEIISMERKPEVGVGGAKKSVARAHIHLQSTNNYK